MPAPQIVVNANDPVFDQEYYRVANQQNCFTLGKFQAAGGAGNYSAAQLWNPTTTKNLILRSMTWYTNAGAAFQGVVFVSTFAFAVAASNGVNKYMGGAASSGEVRSAVGAFAGLGGAQIYLGPCSAAKNVYIWKPGEEQIVLPPSTGILVQADVANQDLAVDFEWIEKTL